jgi:hypothetical protein
MWMLKTNSRKPAMLLNILSNNGGTIDSLYGVIKTDFDAVKNREAKVAELIKTMGHKYLLSRPMPRIK